MKRYVYLAPFLFSYWAANPQRLHSEFSASCFSKHPNFPIRNIFACNTPEQSAAQYVCRDVFGRPPLRVQWRKISAPLETIVVTPCLKCIAGPDGAENILN